ncbi:MAG: response regulator, partial [Victivallaceae bacterium]
LTDMWMPEMNGAELAAKIRAIPEINSIKIVVVTADTEQAEVQKSGVFDGVLLKPITIDAIRKTLDLLNIKSKESPATGHMEQNK